MLERLEAGDGVYRVVGEVDGLRIADAKALNIPLDQAEVLVTNKEMEGRALKEFRNEDFAGQLQVTRVERGGVPIPLGADTQLQRFDVLFVTGLKTAVMVQARKLEAAYREIFGRWCA